MALLLTMLPIYLFGNLHCIGMCGPLVMMIGKHKYKNYYFIGRTLSFTLAGMIAGGIGSVLNVIIAEYHIPTITSFLFGSTILLIGCSYLFKWKLPGGKAIAHILNPINKKITPLIMKDDPISTFLFGFMTIFLPCGQTVIVYSACALYGDIFVGTLNGFIFALLTSPSLFFAMQAHHLLYKIKAHYNLLIGLSAIVIGALALCRGFADLGMIPHWILNPNSAEKYHLVMF
ncbi:MAG: sulfite exporter TauE/SafE family protein [Chlamydiota bacterium]|nr:sulfite exporter TauE/SafE family protein [Chlamydiota bacterium]